VTGEVDLTETFSSKLEKKIKKKIKLRLTLFIEDNADLIIN